MAAFFMVGHAGLILSPWRGVSFAPSSCQGAPLQVTEASEVIDEVRHSDFHPRPCQADRADEEVHAVLLVGEDVLDGSAYFRFERIRLRCRRAHRPAFGLFTMDESRFCL